MLLLPASVRSQPPEFAPVVAGRPLRFPDDEGSHPEFRTEWWYVTGWLNAERAPLGFQVTFFRTRPHPTSANPSRFAPTNILIAHAALSEPKRGRLRHAQRVARAGFGLAEARRGRMDVLIDDWILTTHDAAYATRIQADELALDLTLRRTQPPLLQGIHGYSRKGPRPESASYYYSLPHLRVTGRVRSGGIVLPVEGSAWLDHEWSSEYMDDEAVGWDWMGINLADGGALMAFRMRGRDGAALWAAATWRQPDGASRTYDSGEVEWRPLRWWQSPRTGARYPVGLEVSIGGVGLVIEPMFDDQENDTRITTGAVYWEGAVTITSQGRFVGRGYLELTGYVQQLRMRS